MRRLISCLCMCVSAFFVGCTHDGGQDQSDGDNSAIEVKPMPSSCVIDSDCDGMGICEAKQCLATCRTKDDCRSGTACDGNLCRPVVDCPAVQRSDGISYSGKKCIKVHSHTPTEQWAKVFAGDLTFDETFVKEGKAYLNTQMGNDFTSPNYVLQVKKEAFTSGFTWGITIYASLQYLKGTLGYANSIMQCFKPKGGNEEAYTLAAMSLEELSKVCGEKFAKGEGNNIGTIRKALREDIKARFCTGKQGSDCDFRDYKNQMLGDQCRKTREELAKGNSLAMGLGSIIGTEGRANSVAAAMDEFIDSFAQFDEGDEGLDGCKNDKCSTADGLADMIAEMFKTQCEYVIQGITGSNLGKIFTTNKKNNDFDLKFCLDNKDLNACLINTGKMPLDMLNDKLTGLRKPEYLLEYIDPEYFWLMGNSFVTVSILTKNNELLAQNDLITAVEYETLDSIFRSKITGQVEVNVYPDYAMASPNDVNKKGQTYSSFSYKEKGGRTTGAVVYRRDFDGVTKPSKAICPNNACSLNILATASNEDIGMKCGGVTFIIKNMSGYVVLKDGDYK